MVWCFRVFCVLCGLVVCMLVFCLFELLCDGVCFVLRVFVPVRVVCRALLAMVLRLRVCDYVVYVLVCFVCMSLCVVC